MTCVCTIHIWPHSLPLPNAIAAKVSGRGKKEAISFLISTDPYPALRSARSFSSCTYGYPALLVPSLSPPESWDCRIDLRFSEDICFSQDCRLPWALLPTTYDISRALQSQSSDIKNPWPNQAWLGDRVSYVESLCLYCIYIYRCFFPRDALNFPSEEAPKFKDKL